jgi:PAT family beta-lactamase induction signal transducer AmpG
MIPLSQHEQTWFVGIRSTLYRLAVLTGQGPLVILAGNLEKGSGNIPYAWMIVFFILAGLFALFFIYHSFIIPHPHGEENKKVSRDLLKKLFSYLIFLIVFIIVLPLYIIMIWIFPVTKIDPRPVLKKLPFSNNPFSNTIILFISKDEFGIAAAFLLTYRLGEAQLVKMAIPFLRDPAEKGGLGLETTQVGLLYGTFGLLSLTLGGILGGFAAAKDGLKKWLWPMIFAINLPDLVYVYLAYTQNNDPIVVAMMVVIEQFGYGFGFTAFMLYLIYISEGAYKTSHYAIATGFMALGMMIPGMFSGAIQEWLGYQTFFIWVCISTIPAFIVAKYIPIDPEFGKKVNKKI